MRPPIIDGEKETAAYLNKGLTENAFTVEVVEDGETGLFLAAAGDDDLIIRNRSNISRQGQAGFKQQQATMGQNDPGGAQQ